MKLRKARLSRGGTIEASYTDAEGNEITIKGKHKCHEDLRNAFARLVPFFADLTEQKEADSIDWSDLEGESNKDLLRRIEVSGISFGGDDTNRFITMTGKRTLYTSRVLNLNSPGVEMDTDTLEWEHVDDFDIAVDGVIFEVTEYLENRKWEVVQRELDFDGNPDDPFAEVDITDAVSPVDTDFESVAVPVSEAS